MEESLPKQERGACGHKGCLRRVVCKVIYNNAQYKKKRMLGHSYWSAMGLAPSGYLSMLERDKRRSEKCRARNREAVNRHRAKMKELYGGRIDHDPIARAQWMIAKEGLHYEEATQRPQAQKGDG